MVPKPSERFPSIFATRRFCNHACSSRWRERGRRLAQTCEACGASFDIHASRGSARFCSWACYQTEHARPPQTCETCGKQFVAYREQRHCSNECVPRSGSANPNFGNRYSGRWTMPAEERLRLSERRLGEGNPNWRGGSPGNNLYRMQRKAGDWARASLGNACSICGASPAEMHHVVPRRLFADPLMPHFRQNLVMLCDRHHHAADAEFRRLLRQGRPRDIPFAANLPPSILDRLARDGSVSRLDPACDFSPIAIEPERDFPAEWFDDTAV